MLSQPHAQALGWLATTRNMTSNSEPNRAKQPITARFVLDPTSSTEVPSLLGLKKFRKILGFRTVFWLMTGNDIWQMKYQSWKSQVSIDRKLLILQNWRESTDGVDLNHSSVKHKLKNRWKWPLASSDQPSWTTRFPFWAQIKRQVQLLPHKVLAKSEAEFRENGSRVSVLYVTWP